MFAIGDYVDVNDRKRTKFSVYGKITEINGDTAVVYFRIPRDPKKGTCEGCRWPGLLSMNGSTGEIECMRSGCGHSHGWEKRYEIIPLLKLINITEKRKIEKKKKTESDFRYNLKNVLDKAIRAGVIREEQKEEVLKILAEGKRENG